MASSDDRFQNTFCFEKCKEKIEARPTSTRSNIIFEKKLNYKLAINTAVHPMPIVDIMLFLYCSSYLAFK